VPASAIVFQLLCYNTCACSITNRLSSMTTLTICVSFCVPALFQHCVSASVFAFVLQQFAFVLQHLCSYWCFIVCVSASLFLHLFSTHNRLPSMTTLTICVSFAVAIFPTNHNFFIILITDCAFIIIILFVHKHEFIYLVFTGRVSIGFF
jgi:hypothetical protein